MMTSPHPARADSGKGSLPAPLAPFREPRNAGQPLDPAVESILAALEGIRYGQLVVSIQDGQLVQIDRTERYRIT